eukprot:gnl/MRDRNA2_/MRDRNA2_177380_c0_seq1.p1 gnl/MRDRNA2_/MRDRNA2_177380_c0~~gnl/MRDRNA2_/MRDRNA2_177380_c0_seq1.p1  ORF type:complete len:674 (+),score=105.98 gnl/MRDRNA2_/MRDRNA2_177380_c0_seq1:166-2022(+)
MPAKQDGNSGYTLRTVVAVGAVGTVGGILIGDTDSCLRRRVLPPATFRTCCDMPMSEAQQKLVENVEDIVGKQHVSTNVRIRGSRLGEGTAMAVVKPGTLSEAIKVLEACVAADVAVLPQGANTSLTGGSVPRDTGCDRPAVVLNMRRLDKILPIGEEGHQVLCFAGAGIFDLQDKLQKDCNRDSHSVLGSIFLNPTVAAGVSYGSGGTQIRKGPAFTDRALFCQISKNGDVKLVNTLGLKNSSLEYLDNVTSLSADDMDHKCRRPASFPRYAELLTKLDSSISRYNADTSGCECNRSEGKVLILATIHDTYPVPQKSKLIWVSCKDYPTAHALKREVALVSAKNCMSKTCEYMNKDEFDIVDRGGRVLINVIDLLGMRRIEPLWNLKLWIESLPVPFSQIICDKVLYWMNPLIPRPISKKIYDLSEEFDHHVLMELAEYSDGEVEALEKRLQKFVSSRSPTDVKYHVCEEGKERTRVTLFRFAVAPSFRTYCIGVGIQGLSIDYALPKNYSTYPILPESKYPLKKRCIASHFGCNVYHEDLAFGNDVDVEKAKKAIKHAIEGINGKLPAEHGHGTEYAAPPETQKRWMQMDPRNIMNPGVGGTSWNRNYSDTPVHLH